MGFTTIRLFLQHKKTKNHLSKMNINEERWFLFVLFLGSLECVYLFAHRIIHVPQELERCPGT